MFLFTIFVISEKPQISLSEGEQIIHNQTINKSSNKIVTKNLNFSEAFNTTDSSIDYTSTTIEPMLLVAPTSE